MYQFLQYYQAYSAQLVFQLSLIFSYFLPSNYFNFHPISLNSIVLLQIIHFHDQIQ